MEHEEEVLCSECHGTGRSVRTADIDALYSFIKTRDSNVLPECEECEGSGSKTVVLWSSEDAAA